MNFSFDSHDAARQELVRERRRKVDDVLGKLESLGSPDQIALHLGSLGIKAQPGYATECAVAVLIRNEFGDDVYVRVESERCEVGGIRHSLPEQVRRFIDKFDHDGYPELTRDQHEYAPCDCGCGDYL